MRDFDPGFAAAVGRHHGQFHRHGETMDTDGDGVDPFIVTPVETFRQKFIAPDVLTGEALDRIKIFEVVMFHGLGPKFQPEDRRRREVWRDFVVAILRGGNDRFALLVKKRGEEEKFGMFEAKPAAAFVNAAFAENKNLFSAAKGINHHGPFFESCGHRRKLTQVRHEGNWLLVETGTRRGRKTSASITLSPAFWSIA